MLEGVKGKVQTMDRVSIAGPDLFGKALISLAPSLRNDRIAPGECDFIEDVRLTLGRRGNVVSSLGSSCG